MSYPAITRPNGKVYRPRKIVAEFTFDDYSSSESGVLVFGTHDIHIARRLAFNLVNSYDSSLMAVDYHQTWLYRTIRNGDIHFEYDPVFGRAAVEFRELVEVPLAQGFPAALGPGQIVSQRFENRYCGKIDVLTSDEAEALLGNETTVPPVSGDIRSDADIQLIRGEPVD